MSARERWRARLGLETGGPGWKVDGPAAPLSPQAELALLAIRELRRTLAGDLTALDVTVGRALKRFAPTEAIRDAYRAASALDIATQRLQARRRVA